MLSITVVPPKVNRNQVTVAHPPLQIFGGAVFLNKSLTTFCAHDAVSTPVAAAGTPDIVLSTSSLAGSYHAPFGSFQPTSLSVIFDLTVPVFRSTTWISKGANSSRMLSDSMATEALDELYGPRNGKRTTDVTDVWFTTMAPLAATRSGRNACVTATYDHTFRSKSFRASLRSISDIGI